MTTSSTPADITPVLEHAAIPATGSHPSAALEHEFTPWEPSRLDETSLAETDVFRLILKFLYVRGAHSGRRIAQQIKLPFGMVEPLLNSLRQQMLIGYRGASMGGDYEYELSPKGIDQARQYMAQCTFCGSAPVSLADYFKSVIQQSLRGCSPKIPDLQQALAGLLVEPELMTQLGMALNRSESLLLWGPPGNGKTTLATRVIDAYPATIWVPRTLVVGGEIIRLFDSSVHREEPLPESEGLLNDQPIDQRWVRIKRPVLVAGGELNLSHLESTLNPVTGIIEAPLQMKSNCGVLVIDDFGRQRVSHIELLNRWIVPMESKHDYLNLPSGRQIKIPFEQMLIFATNIRPEEIVDEAFLRRIPYKVHVGDPTEQQFRQMLEEQASRMDIDWETRWADSLISEHYRNKNRPWRFSHAAALLQQIRDFCHLFDRPAVVNEQTLQMAVHNFFSEL